MAQDFISALDWRYSIKKFDSSRSVSQIDLDKIKQAIRMAPSSIGLQPYAILEVKSPELRQQIMPVAWGQSQIVEASRLLVFCSMNSLPADYIDRCAERHRGQRKGDQSTIDQFKEITNALVGSRSPEQLAAWAKQETYIAVGFALAACAELHIDACPIGGFDPKAVDDILGLSARNLSAALLLPIGYRSPDDTYCKMPKVRKPEENLFLEL